MSLFSIGNFLLYSGKKSKFKIDCDFLSDEDIESLAFIFSRKFKFREVHGIPNGGIRLAEKLKKYITEDIHYPILIVDDVSTTGNSFIEYSENFFPNQIDVMGVCIFCRDRISCPEWVISIFEMGVEDEEIN